MTVIGARIVDGRSSCSARRLFAAVFSCCDGFTFRVWMIDCALSRLYRQGVR